MTSTSLFQASEDSDTQQDTTSVGITFLGFSSPACGIRAYEWALGSEPGWSDILPYSSVGIVMLNDSHGQAQTHLHLQHGQVIYASVRAHLGMGEDVDDEELNMHKTVSV